MALWGRKEPGGEKSSPPAGATEPAVRPVTPVAVPQPPAPAPAATPAGTPRGGTLMEGRSATIGPSIHVKGELLGNEDLVIEGRVEGIVRLRDHHLTVGKSATILATIEAKSIRVEGNVQGDVQATERVELAPGSTVSGDITSPRVSIADGARFKGSVDMDKGPRPATAAASGGAASTATAPSAPAKPVSTSA